MRFIKALMIAAVLCLVGCATTTGAKTIASTDDQIVLTENNTISLRMAVYGKTVAKLQQKAYALSKRLPANATIYLVLDTPGGSIVSGMEMINALKNLPQEVKTITNFSASMGFITVQGLGERLILPQGILMSHRAFTAEWGQTPGEFESRSKFWQKYIDEVHALSAKRIGMTPAALMKKHYDEWWLYGEDAVAANAADRVVNATCGESLAGTYKDVRRRWWGTISIEWSKCPLISYPVDVKFGFDWGIKDDKRQEIDKFYKTMLYNKREFLTKYIVTGKFVEYLK